MKINKLVVAGVGLVATGLSVAGCGQLDNANAPASSSPPPVSSAPSSAPSPAPTSESAPADPSQGGGSDDGQSADSGSSSGSHCTAADLSVKAAGGDAGAGSVYTTLTFTNKSSKPCEIQGYPGVSYVTGDSGRQVGESAYRPGGSQPKITLAPGKSASAQLQRAQAGNFDPSQCKPTPVRGLRVYPPHDTASVYVPLQGTGCAGSTSGSHQLVIKPVQ